MATGSGAALVVLGLVTAVFLRRPDAGFVALFASLFLGACGLSLFVQHRGVTAHRGVTRTTSGEEKHISGMYGGAFAAWVTGASGDDVEGRLHYAAAAVAFCLTLTVGSALALFFAHSVADALASVVA